MSRIKQLAIGLAATAAIALPATAAAADGPATGPAPAVETTEAGTQGDKCWFGWPFQWLCFEIDPPSCIPGQICPASTNDLGGDEPLSTAPY